MLCLPGLFECQLLLGDVLLSLLDDLLLFSITGHFCVVCALSVAVLMCLCSAQS